MAESLRVEVDEILGTDGLSHIVIKLMRGKWVEGKMSALRGIGPHEISTKLADIADAVLNDPSIELSDTQRQQINALYSEASQRVPGYIDLDE